jgi:RimJ/RimL family protein N-acetyltransferase
MLIGNPPVELPAPPLASGLLLLREWSDSDVRSLVEACADPLTSRYTSVPIPYTPEDARRFISFGRSPTALPLAVASADDDTEMLGAVGLHAVSLTRRRSEIGYWTAPWARGQGVAQTALELLSNWALGPLGLERLDLYVEPENESSQRVAERAGYKRGALVRSGIALRGRRYDVVRYSLLA